VLSLNEIVDNGHADPQKKNSEDHPPHHAIDTRRQSREPHCPTLVR
jgi:hypothetical protein